MTNEEKSITVAVRMVVAIEVSARAVGDDGVQVTGVRHVRPPSADDVQRALVEDEDAYDEAVADVRGGK